MQLRRTQPKTFCNVTVSILFKNVGMFRKQICLYDSFLRSFPVSGG